MIDAKLSDIDRNRLLDLIDDVWNQATDSPEVPDPRWANRIINKWLERHFGNINEEKA